MKSLKILLFVLLFAGCSKPPPKDPTIKFYQSPMHPWITSDKPGRCTICGMELVPVREGDPGIGVGDKTIKLSASSIDVLGVSVVPVRHMQLTKTLRFSGNLVDDENVHRVIAAFYNGRIDDIYVDHVGQYVEKGQALASIYSPDLLYVVREFQNAMKGSDQNAARNSAQRLVQYGLTPDQVNRLAKLSSDVYTIDIQAPMSGTIVVKKAYKGQYIKTGEPMFEMGELSRLWFHAEVYERDLPDIKVGQKAILRTPTVPGREFAGIVDFIDPDFDEQTRSTKVRIIVDNPMADGEARGLRRVLPRGAYAEADIIADLGEALVVPRSAVLRDGRRTVAYVQGADGRYEQRAVQVGRIGDQGIEILAGLKEGEKVVAQGNLMMDAESQLRAGASQPETGSEPIENAKKLPTQTAALAFLEELSKVSDALAGDDAVAAVKSSQNLKELASQMTPAGDQQVDSEIGQLQQLHDLPIGGDLKALRQVFLPWSTHGAALAQALTRAGSSMPYHVFECPMTDDSFPGAPPKSQWVQAGAEIRNPYRGSEMPDCGTLVKP